MRMALKRLVVLGTATGLAACVAQTDGTGTDGSEDASVGTSPYTNCSFDSDASGETFDTVILNGRVMDPECDFDGVRNVGIQDGRIALITEGEISGDDVVDAEGLVVAPGFIDTHTHGFDLFTNKVMARDGVTTVMDMENGAKNVAMFYEKYEGNAMLNFGGTVGHEPVRMSVLDGLPDEVISDSTFLLNARGAAGEDGHNAWASDVPDEEQAKQILNLIEEGVRQGAIGVVSTVGYMGPGTPTRELYEIQRISANYGRLFGSHTRFGPNENLPLDYTLGSREIFANAAAFGGALILLHIHNQSWEEAYEMCELGREQGMNVICEYYPYLAGLPNIASPNMDPELLPSQNIVVERDIYVPSLGRFLTGVDEYVEMRTENPSMPIVLYVRKEEDLPKWIAMKNIAIGSDAIAMVGPDGKGLPIETPYEEYVGHPRIAGTRGRIFRMAREQGLPLMDIVNNAAYVPARSFSLLGLEAMQRRGRIQEGMVADIAIFDPETITDNADYPPGEQALPTTGLPHVLVNGVFVVRDSKVDLNARPGQPIRFPVVE